MKHFPDIAFLAALAGLACGFYQAWPPLGWIVPSAVVMAVIVLHHFSQRPGETE